MAPSQHLNDLAIAKRYVWRLRDDVRKGASAEDAPTSAFEAWWLLKGRSEYPLWDHLSDEQIAFLRKPVGELKFGNLSMPLPQALSQVLQYRADVIKRFTVDDKLDAVAVAGWFFMQGIQQHRMQAVIDRDLVRNLDRPLLVATSAADNVPAVTVLMRLVWQLLDPSLKETMALERSESRERFIAWFFGYAVKKFDLYPLIAGRWRQWLQVEYELPQHPSVLVPKFATMELLINGELQKRFDLSKDEDARKFRVWAQRVMSDGEGYVGHWAWLRQAPVLASEEPDYPIVPLAERPFGVNLYGFAYGELGIGEDLRMAVEACEAAGVPYRVVNVDAGKELRQSDVALKDHVARSEQEAPYAINVFCLPGFDMVSRVFLRMGPEVFREHINIGWWPWELSVWPKAWRDAFDLVDEVWSGSDFARAMYAVATPKPVTLMPLPVSVERGVKEPRSHYDLPARKFLFLFVFDFNSSLNRKNPDAVVAAFKKAFPKKDSAVGLVLKVMNAKEKDKRWLAFKESCDSDNRIRLLTQTMDRHDVLGLVHACDAYVSLHRAEGFGRTLAEAMLYGKPVVATNYSGNTDFMNPDLTFPVSFELMPVKTGDYAFVETGDGAQWAEPDISDAAAQMKAARTKAKDKTYAAKVKAFAEQQFSVKRIGQLMQARLHDVAEGRGLFKTGA